MCLAQGPQRIDAGEARTWGPRSQAKHSTTEPLRSLNPSLWWVKMNGQIKNFHIQPNKFG